MKYIFIILLSLVVNSHSIAGPWPRAKGSFYAQFVTYLIPPTPLVTINGAFRYMNRPILDATFQAYGEYGITNRFTLIASLPVKWVQAGNIIEKQIFEAAGDPPSTILSGGSLVGLGNAELEAKYAFINKKTVLSGRLKVQAPTGLYQQSTDLRTAYPGWGYILLFLLVEHGIDFTVLQMQVLYLEQNIVTILQVMQSLDGELKREHILYSLLIVLFQPIIFLVI